MSKYYTFTKENLINLLFNHKKYFSEKVQELIIQGKDPGKITLRTTKKWTEDFLEEQMKYSEVDVNELFDKFDEQLEKVGLPDSTVLATKINENKH